MSLVTANNQGVVTADFSVPLSRAWHIDFTASCSDPSLLNGAVTVDVANGTLQFKGTAKAEDAYLGTVRARVVAGAGGLPKPASPKYYQQSTVSVVLQDLLAAAGETMSSSADAGVLGTILPSWTVVAQPVADALSLLMTKVGASWRMLADGTFWCGTESWPDAGVDFSLEHDDQAHSQIIVSTEAPLLLPGTALGGRKLSYVETHLDASTVTTTAWLVTSTSSDRLNDTPDAMTRSCLPAIDYSAPYRCRVAAQSGSKLDLIPDDPRLPAAGLSGIPLRGGLPGTTVMVAPGAYVLLGFMGADPSLPFCSLWEGGETVTLLQLAGTHPAPLFDTFFTDLATWIGTVNTLLGTLVPGTGATGGPAYATAIALPTSLVIKMATPTNYLSQIVSNG